MIDMLARKFCWMIGCWAAIAATFATTSAEEGRPTIVEAVELPVRDADGVVLADLTGNGKIDILASEGKHGVTVWFEQGEDWKTWTKHPIHTFETKPCEIEGNALGDFNGNGRLEAISLDQPGGKIYLHQHDGDPRSPWQTAVIQADRPLVQDTLVADIDGDGRVDLVYTWEGRARGAGGVHWLKLVGDDPLDPEHWRDHVMTQHESAWWLGPRQADLSGNGEATDIVFTARNLRSRNPGARPGLFWMTPGADVTQPWTVHTIDDTLPHPLHVDMGNFSGAGHGLDLVVSGFNTQIIYWFAYSDNWKRHELQVPRVNGVQPDRVWNVKAIPLGRAPEGKRDAIFAPLNRGNRGAVLWYEFDDQRYQPHVLRLLDYGHPMDDDILLHDVTGDGQLEAFVPDSGPGVNKLHIFRFGRE